MRRSTRSAQSCDRHGFVERRGCAPSTLSLEAPSLRSAKAGGTPNGKRARSTSLPPLPPSLESRLRIYSAYHLVAIASLNSQLSRFNIQAPYAVRRAPLAYTIELASCIRDSSKAIEAELKKRMDGFVPPLTAAREGKAGDREFDGTEEGRVVESAWGAFKRAMGEVVRLGRA